MKLRSLYAAAAACVLVCTSCKAGVVTAPEAERERERTRRASRTLTERDVDAVLRSVSVARQLEARRDIRVDHVGPREFRALLRDDEPAVDERGLSPRAAFLLGFDFVPPPAERARVAPTSQVLEEEIAGFYDRAEDRIVVPRLPIQNEHDEVEQRAILAHEAQHALQAQHFPAPPQPENDDQHLAQLALWEGDAMVAMGAYLGSEQGAPVGRTFRRIGDATREVSASRMTHGTTGRAVDRALPLVREELAFPYDEGMLFVTDLYRAGGYPLVNEAFARPPVSTMEVLHPQKFLAGIKPRPFAEPAVPPGLRSVTSGVLGELRTRVLLSRCNDRARATEAAAGWAGDRFLVVVDDKGRLSLGWATAWDSAEEAAEFEKTVTASADCFRDNELDEGGSAYSIGPTLSVSRRGEVVAVVRGAPSKDATLLASTLISAVRPALPAAPRSDRVIPPREELPEPRKGRVKRGRYVNEWLGLAGRVPHGMRSRAGGELDLEIEHPLLTAFGGLALSTRISSKEQDDRTFKEALSGIREALERGGIDGRVKLVRSGSTRTPLGRGTERLWVVDGTALELRMILVPVCAGTGSVVFIAGAAEPEGRALLDKWLKAFRWESVRDMDACRFLDPK
jgi:hypothetical protein